VAKESEKGRGRPAAGGRTGGRGRPATAHEDQLDITYNFKWAEDSRELAARIARSKHQDLSGWVRGVLADAIRTQLPELIRYEEDLRKLRGED
jgi:hypothetical protein